MFFTSTGLFLIGKTATKEGYFEGSFIKFLKDTDTSTNISTNRLALGHAGDRFDATDYSVSSNIKYNKTLNIIKGGNVGIGVINPSAKLHVEGDAILSKLKSIGISNSIDTAELVEGNVTYRIVYNIIIK